VSEWQSASLLELLSSSNTVVMLMCYLEYSFVFQRELSGAFATVKLRLYQGMLLLRSCAVW
jgi:hypothetical protein